MSDNNQPKAGIKTTEFWLSLVATVLCGVAASYADQTWGQMAGVIGAALITMGYGASRAKAKS